MSTLRKSLQFIITRFAYHARGPAEHKKIDSKAKLIV